MSELLKDPVEKLAVEQYEYLFDLKDDCVQLRKQSGMSQAQLAEKMDVNVEDIASFEASHILDTTTSLGFLFDYVNALGAKVAFTIEE